MSDGDALRELREWASNAYAGLIRLAKLNEEPSPESSELFRNRAWGYGKMIEEIDRRLAALEEGGEK